MGYPFEKIIAGSWTDEAHPHIGRDLRYRIQYEQDKSHEDEVEGENGGGGLARVSTSNFFNRSFKAVGRVEESASIQTRQATIQFRKTQGAKCGDVDCLPDQCDHLHERSTDASRGHHLHRRGF